MRRLLAALVAFAALVAPAAARADGLSDAEMARLSRRETVIREQTLERGDRRYVGGVTYTLLDAPATEVAALIDNPESLRRVLPRTKTARIVGRDQGDALIELVQGTSMMEATYTIRMRRSAGESRFWLEPSHPHGIDDAWGFFRYQPFVTPAGEERVLLTYGVLVDVGPGVVRELFEERLRSALLSVPQLVRREFALRSSMP